MSELVRGQGAIEQRFAQRIRAIREAFGWSAQVVADRLAEQGNSGLDRRVLLKIETGDRRLTLDEAVMLCKVFGVSIADMVSPESIRIEVRAEVTL